MAARTAVVAGTAGAVSHKQQQRYARKDAEATQQAQMQQQMDQQAQMQQQAVAQPVAPQPVPAAAPATDIIGQLEKLADLKANGLLTDAEYTAAKAQLLG